MITEVRLKIEISLTHEEWCYELEFKTDSENSSLSLRDSMIPFSENEFDSLLFKNCDFFWNLGKQVAESSKVKFLGYAKCEDELSASQYNSLKSTIDKMNKKYNTNIDFIS